jgi:membrane-associated phospholipid phosphatase
MAQRSAERRPDGGALALQMRLRAALVAHSGPGSARSWTGFQWQVALLLPPALLYFFVRDLSAGQEAAAFENASSIVSLQKTLGLDWEATLQQRVLDTDWIISAVNWIYIYGHFPLLFTVLVLLFGFSKRDFVTLRNALVASGVVGLVCFALYPVAPPRLFAPDQFFDSLGELSTSYQILQNPKVTNQFAAVPSFHVGWNLLAAIAVWRATRFRPLRLIAAVVPVLMMISVLLTANHWVLDIVAGVAVAMAGITGAKLFERYATPRLRPEPVDATAASDATVDLRSKQPA